MTEPAMGPHHCTGCGEMHGGEYRENPEVAIARINREADVKIAELQRGEFQQTPLEAETEIAVTEIEAAAAVEEAAVKADVLEEIITPPEPDPEPVVVVEDQTAAAGPEMEDAPPEIGEAPPEKKPSNPWW